MGRTSGSRNRDYDERRASLCRALVPHLLVGGKPSTLSDLARAAGVSVPTLRHYFTNREGVLTAVLAQAHTDYAAELEAMTDGADDVQASLIGYLSSLVGGWRHSPLGTLIAGSLAIGMENPAQGHAAVDHVLEPTLQTLEARLAHQVAAGALASTLDVRAGALMLVSPVLMALLHQDGLDGVACRPLDVDDLVHKVVRGFLSAYGTAPHEA